MESEKLESHMPTETSPFIDDVPIQNSQNRWVFPMTFQRSHLLITQCWQLQGLAASGGSCFGCWRWVPGDPHFGWFVIPKMPKSVPPRCYLTMMFSRYFIKVSNVSNFPIYFGVSIVPVAKWMSMTGRAWFAKPNRAVLRSCVGFPTCPSFPVMEAKIRQRETAVEDVKNWKWRFWRWVWRSEDHA